MRPALDSGRLLEHWSNPVPRRMIVHDKTRLIGWLINFTMNKNKPKIFILGLPRTGTTSLCIYLLEAGFTVAHNAYTKACVESAEVIADTPVFADFEALNQRYPNALNILLERDQASWTRSAYTLCQKLSQRQAKNAQSFHPLLQKSYNKVFGGFENQSYEKLTQSYQQYRENVLSYFSDEPERLLSINIINEPERAIEKLQLFLSIKDKSLVIPHTNKNVINDWDNIKHSNKVASHLRGSEGRKYFDE